jgi:hypothetical protein
VLSRARDARAGAQAGYDLAETVCLQVNHCFLAHMCTELSAPTVRLPAPLS